MKKERKIYKLLLVFLGCFIFLSARAQEPCTVLGQQPGTAFPVCGTAVFKQKTVPECQDHEVPVPCGGNALYSNRNPYWYKFTCFQTGTLSFKITPNNLGDDYDWQLFDVTNHSPEDVFSNPGLFVCGNWSGSYGLTGANSSATSDIQCASDPAKEHIPTFSKSPTLIAGHNYLLLVSHFTLSQSGYSLSFGGGTAVITDPTLPSLKSVTPTCDPGIIKISFSKKMQCKTLAADGSDFSIEPAIATVVSAVSEDCSGSFDMQRVTITTSAPLPPGDYNLVIKTGSDGNTILDNCDNALNDGDKLPFTIGIKQPTPLDSVTSPTCASDTLQLVFRHAIECSSLAGDGSDFLLTGPSPVSIIGIARCGNNANDHVTLKLSGPIVTGGVYTITLKAGTDGGTIVDECGEVTPAGQSVQFVAYDTVSADFSYNINYGCTLDTLSLFHPGGNGINSWVWTTDGDLFGQQQNEIIEYTTFNTKKISLTVSNGVCFDTRVKNILLENYLSAGFMAPAFDCPTDPFIPKDTSIGQIVNWNWNFGDGNADNKQVPDPHSFPVLTRDQLYTVSLTVEDKYGCTDTATRKVTMLHSCFIAVPTGFTPNGDGINDFLYPLNAYKAEKLHFAVYNRYGQLVFETRDWTKRWDGKINDQPQPAGTYVWMLEYTDHDTGRHNFQKGTTVLIR